jgi:small subunit ribosomal protein S6
MERYYEVMFIVRPDIADDELDKLIAGLEQTVTSGGGTVRSSEKMGRRKLAYLVRKFSEGIYVLLTIDADGPLVAELERRMRVTEPVIKFLTVRMDEEDKRIEKLKAIRASRPKLSDQKPAESEEATAEAKPAETKPAETKTEEAKPAEEKPAEEKPAEAKTAEEKPAEAKTAEEKPAEEAEETEEAKA